MAKRGVSEGSTAIVRKKIKTASTRYWRWRAAGIAAGLAPPIRRWTAFYIDPVPAREVGECIASEERAPLRTDPRDAPFLRLLPEALPAEVVRRTDLFRLRGLTVRGDTGRILDEAGQRLVMFSHMGDVPTYRDVRPTPLRAVDKAGGPWFHMVGSHRGHRHLFHFIFDRLPSLHHFIEHMPEGGDFTVLTNEDLPGFQSDLYAHLARKHPRLRFMAVPRRERWRLDELWRVDFQQNVKPTAAAPRFLDWVRQSYFEAYGIEPERAPRRRLFISRLDARLRRLAGEEALHPMLERHGVEVIQAARLSYRDQVALFANAELVAGVHGAGFTNQLYARPDARIVEIFPANKVKNTFFLLANALGQRHRHVIGSRGGRAEAFSADPAAIETAIAAAVGELPPRP